MTVFGRRQLLIGVLARIVGSTALAWVLYEPLPDPSRIYYGTDTRAVGLLAGVALAFAVAGPPAAAAAAPGGPGSC